MLCVRDSSQYSRKFWLLFYSFFGLCILGGTFIDNPDVTYFGVTGGFFGSFCSLIVLVSISRLDKEKKGASTSLLFWRSLCDFGIGMRFLTGSYWNYWQCGMTLCDLTDKNHCWLPAGLLEFFELSSEAWFLCVAIDLMVSVTDPFSSPKARLFRYHLMSWTFGGIMGMVVVLDDRINGVWSITPEVTNHGFCWIQNHTSSSDINWKPFVMFYCPILIVYSYALYVIYSSYQRLRQGISKTFQHRVTMLTVNAINVTVYFAYWTVLLIMYIIVNEMAFKDPQVAQQVFNVLIFALSGKGYVDLVVYIIADEGRSTSNAKLEAGEFEKLNSSDFNAALREEVLHYATTGIRVCAHRASRAKESKHKVVLSMAQNTADRGNEMKLSPWFFIKLMFSSRDELTRLRAFMLRDSTMVSRREQTKATASEFATGNPMIDGAFKGETATHRGSRNLQAPAQIALLNERGQSVRTINEDEEEHESDDSVRVQQAVPNDLPRGSSSPMRRNGTPEGGAGGGPPRGNGSRESYGSAVGDADALKGLRGSFSQQDSMRNLESISDDLRITEMSDVGESSGRGGGRTGSGNSNNSSCNANKQGNIWSVRAGEGSDWGSPVPGKIGIAGADGERGSKRSNVNAPGRLDGTSQRTNSAASVFSQAEGGFVAGTLYLLNAMRVALCGAPQQKDELVHHVRFTEYEPFYFRLVRQCSNVDDEMFKNAFRNTIKERLTEGGASGAFFFFSKGEQFIAKSCNDDEMNVLIDNAAKYANYLSNHRGSFITRIYGAYQLHIYGTDLNFFVMNNILLTPGDEIINEKYDIKGSWVARNSRPPQEGQRVPCKFCNQTYVYRRKTQGVLPITSSTNSTSKNGAGAVSALGAGGAGKLSRKATGGISIPEEEDEKARCTSKDSRVPQKSLAAAAAGFITGAGNNTRETTTAQAMQDRCPFTVLGIHEPNVILKDNDLKHKIRLPGELSQKVLEQLKADADFLCNIGIMDYSLLIGVHNTEYEVEDMDAAMARRTENSMDTTGSGTNGASERSRNNSSAAGASAGAVPSTPGGSGAAGSWNNALVDSGPGGSSNSGMNASLKRVTSMKPAGWGQGNNAAGGSVGSGGGASVGRSSSALNQRSTSYGPAATHSVLEEIPSSQRGRRMQVSRVVGPEAYYMGIIDFQQKWDWNKRAERFFKVVLKGADPLGLSSINPIKYRERFVRRLEELLDVDDMESVLQQQQLAVMHHQQQEQEQLLPKGGDNSV